MDYNTDLRIIEDVPMSVETGRQRIVEFMSSNEELDGIQMLQLGEILDNM